jgi:hypothetical protein
MAIAKTGENEPENTVSIVRRVSKQTVLTVLTQTAPFLVSMIRLERPALFQSASGLAFDQMSFLVA